ncbi:MAG TPA: PIN domain-containing protein [Vicinamibacteria bacterium]|nr:PIN domain-containing protein [Vicinamibacteria bacterium]
MSDRVFVDTNVLVYLFDSDQPEKQDSARNLLNRLVKEATIVVSTQVLQEFYVTVTMKLAEPLPPQDAIDATRGISAYHVVQVDPSLIFAAIKLHEEEGTSFWDAMIIRAALESGCELLMSEDMQHGRRFGNLTVDNPFR